MIAGRLYCNIWNSYRVGFEKDLTRYIQTANKRWKTWFGSVESGPFNTHCIGHGDNKNWCLDSPAWSKDQCAHIFEDPDPSKVNNDADAIAKVDGKPVATFAPEHITAHAPANNPTSRALVLFLVALGIVAATLAAFLLYLFIKKRQEPEIV